MPTWGGGAREPWEWRTPQGPSGRDRSEPASWGASWRHGQEGRVQRLRDQLRRPEKRLLLYSRSVDGWHVPCSTVLGALLRGPSEAELRPSHGYCQHLRLHAAVFVFWLPKSPWASISPPRPLRSRLPVLFPPRHPFLSRWAPGLHSALGPHLPSAVPPSQLLLWIVPPLCS